MYYLMPIYDQIVNRKLEAFSSEEVRNLEIAHDQVLMAIRRARNRNSKKDVAGQDMVVASTNQFITPDDAKEDKCGGEIHGEKGELFDSPQSEQVTLLKPEKTYSKAGKSILRSIHTRFKEHIAHLRYGRTEKSCVAEHALECNHKVTVDNLKLIKNVQDRRFLDAYESMEIIRCKNRLNKDRGPIPFSPLYMFIEA